MNATPADQRRLLDLADLDARIVQTEAARKSPPQSARVQELIASRQALSRELAERSGARDDLRTELARIESDVKVVEARRARDTQLLTSVANAKDAAGLEHELASLTKRQGDLEDAELELMERLEEIEASVAAQEAVIAETNAEGARLSSEAKTFVAEATALGEQLARDRAAVAGGIPADLSGLYERLRTRNAGAALLRARTCGGCHMVLAGTDMQAVRQSADDLVVTCPECGCILVRTEESGL